MIKEPKIKLRRRDAYSPRSASWTLYKPEKLAEIFEASPEIVDKTLEETGFYKAVKIREGLIKWKMLLLDQCKELEEKRSQLEKELKDIKLQLKVNNSILQNIRNLLRIPREKEGADKIINELFMKEEKMIKAILFVSNNCPACKPFKRKLDNVMKKFEAMEYDIQLEIINGSNDIEKCKDYNVMSFPTLILMENGQEKDRCIGNMSEKTIFYKIHNLIDKWED